MERDRNLLFGVLAVQLRKITASQLVAAAGAWATDPSLDLAERLEELAGLSREDRALVEHFVNEAVKAHKGDAGSALSSYSDVQAAFESFRGSLVMDESDPSTVRESSLGESGAAASARFAGVLETPGRYSNAHEYASGGMGRVMLVHDEHLGRDIALKELLPWLAEPAEESASDSDSARLSSPFMARFLQEARITGQLEHPSIVPVYELGHRDDGTLYYTMKLVRGETLTNAICACGSLEQRLRLLPHVVDLCQAIAYAHSRGIIHRDIKPGNVMVGQFGETVVLDWGLAASRDRTDVHRESLAASIRAMDMPQERKSGDTPYGHALGTPSYMPPEQANGLLDEIDERSDIYSLGAVLYELLTGSPPFPGRNPHRILEQVRTEAPASVASLAPKAPPELAAVCARALSKAKEERYASAMELADEIARFQSGALVQAYRYGPGERLARVVQKHRHILVSAGVSLLVLSVAAVGFFLRERSLRFEAERAEQMASRQHREALLQTERADRNFKQARRAVDELSSLLAEAAPLGKGGSHPIRKRILEAVLRYYEAFAEEEGGDEEVQADLASACQLMGGIVSRIGAAEEAIAYYDRAIAAYGPLASGELPGNARYRVCLAEALIDRGNLCRGAGRYDQASESFREAVALLDAARDPEGLHGDRAVLARALNSQALLCTETGAYDTALAHHEQAVRIREALVAAAPDTPDCQHDLARSHGNYGLLLEKLSRDEEALERFVRARRLFEELVATEPDHPAYRCGLATALNNEARALYLAGKTAAALDGFGKAVAVCESLHQDYPDIWRYQELLAGYCGNLAGTLDAEGRAGEACAAQLRAVALREQMAELRPGDFEHRVSLAEAHQTCGRICASANQDAQAAAQYGRSVALLEELVETCEGDASLKTELAYACNDFAWHLLTRPSQAKPGLDRALDLALRARDLTGGNNAAILDTLALALSRVGRVSEAAKAQAAALAVLRRAGEGSSALAAEFEARLSGYEAAQRDVAQDAPDGP